MDSCVLLPRVIAGIGSREMGTIQDIRRANLLLLIKEVEQLIGRKHGAKAYLARRTGVPSPQLSQFLSRAPHQGGGPRGLGDDSARKLERGMGKPKGWMDVEHATVSADDAKTVDQLKLLTASQRQLIDAQITEFVRLNLGPSQGRQDAGDSPSPKPH
jgi:hypothetical protein